MNAFWGFSAEKIARPIRIRAISSTRTWIHGLWGLVGVLSATPLRINIVLIILSRPEAYCFGKLHRVISHVAGEIFSPYQILYWDGVCARALGQMNQPSGRGLIKRKLAIYGKLTLGAGCTLAQ